MGTLLRLAEAGVNRVYVTEWGSTVWNDAVLNKKPSERTVEEKELVKKLKKSRRILTVAQGHITLRTDGGMFRISMPVKKFELE